MGLGLHPKALCTELRFRAGATARLRPERSHPLCKVFVVAGSHGARHPGWTSTPHAVADGIITTGQNAPPSMPSRGPDIRQLQLAVCLDEVGLGTERVQNCLHPLMVLCLGYALYYYELLARKEGCTKHRRQGSTPRIKGPF